MDCQNGYTFLMKAAAKDYSNSMILLLENGADVDVVDARSVSFIIYEELRDLIGISI